MVEDDGFMYIPILQSLQTLLRNDAVYIEVGTLHKFWSAIYIILLSECGHRSSSSILNYCDGVFFPNILFFSTYSDALEIFLFYDELEICNPFGSKVEIHKHFILKISLNGNLLVIVIQPIVGIVSFILLHSVMKLLVWCCT